MRVGNFLESSILLGMRLAVVLVAACTASQARTAHRAGEIAAAGGLIGIIGTVGVSYAFPGEQSTILNAGIAFVPITVIGALIYIATDGTVNTTSAPDVRADRTQDTAMELAKQAKHAARRGDCAEVLAIEPRVRALDPDIYRRFLHDDVIKTCLPSDTQSAEPPSEDSEL
jgi:hypothetical protein